MVVVVAAADAFVDQLEMVVLSLVAMMLYRLMVVIVKLSYLKSNYSNSMMYLKQVQKRSSNPLDRAKISKFPISWHLHYQLNMLLVMPLILFHVIHLFRHLFPFFVVRLMIVPIQRLVVFAVATVAVASDFVEFVQLIVVS